MNQLFNDKNLRVDTNTGKELNEEGWRVPDQDEGNVYAAYYLKTCSNLKKYKVFRVLFLLLFLVSAGELMFEMLCREDPSFNPLPFGLGILFSIVLLILNEVLSRHARKVQLKAIQNTVYVTDAIAYNYQENKVQIMLNHKKLCFQRYAFKQAVSPTDYAYDESGSQIGFYVRYYIVLAQGKCLRKDVLGSEEYQYYHDRMLRAAGKERYHDLYGNI